MKGWKAAREVGVGVGMFEKYRRNLKRRGEGLENNWNIRNN